jgi:phosphate starvation-inducible PhoH-like protein
MLANPYICKNAMPSPLGGKMRKGMTRMKVNDSLPLYTGFASTPNQELYLDSLNNKKLTIVHGPAGTGKTMIACAHAVQELNSGVYKKVIITRPAVTVDEEHGYLPGDLNQKMLPWLIPIYDNFTMFTTKSTLDYYIDTGKIEIAPLSFIRGRTFHNTLIIADEMQNSTKNQMKTLLTRLGTDSNMIVTGDLQQCDLQLDEDNDNGLLDFIKRFNCFNDEINDEDIFVGVIELNYDDVQRSDVVKHILEIYDHDIIKK